MFCHSKQQSVIQQLHARKGRLIVMCSKGEGPLVCSNGSCRVIEVPQVEDCLQPVVNIVPLQVSFPHTLKMDTVLFMDVVLFYLAFI